MGDALMRQSKEVNMPWNTILPTNEKIAFVEDHLEGYFSTFQNNHSFQQISLLMISISFLEVAMFHIF
jgi:hypothetical protein